MGQTSSLSSSAAATTTKRQRKRNIDGDCGDGGRASSSLPLPDPCVFRRNENGAGPDRYAADQRYRYRPPLCVDPHGAQKLADFLTRHAGTDILLCDEPSGTSSLVAVTDIDADIDGKSASGDSVRGGGDGWDGRVGGGAPQSIDLWHKAHESEGGAPATAIDWSVATLRDKNCRMRCVMAHGLTLVYQVESCAVRPVDDMRTHEVTRWLAVVRLSSRADEVAVHAWPNAARRVRGPYAATTSWESPLAGAGDRLDLVQREAQIAMAADYRYFSPHTVCALFADGRVAVLDISATSCAALAAPSFVGWRTYETAFAAHRAHPVVGLCPSDGCRLTIAYPVVGLCPSHDCRLTIASRVDSYAPIRLPLCLHLVADRRRRVATAFVAAQVPLVLVDLVCDYVTVGVTSLDEENSAAVLGPLPPLPPPSPLLPSSALGPPQ